MKFLSYFFLFISFFVLSSCNSSSSTGLAGNFTAFSYTGAGSNTNWRMVLNTTGAFAAIESISNTSVLGTYSRDISGFVKIQITSAAGASAPTTFPINLAGLELPGVAFVMQPIFSSETALITAVLSGNCPGNSIAANYIYTQFNSSDNMTSAAKGFFGTSVFLSDSGTASAPTYYTLSGGYPKANAGFATGSGICFNGISNLSNQSVDYVMSSGSFIKFANGGDTSGLISIPTQTLTTMASLTGNYAGLVYDGAAGTVFPIQTVLTPSGNTAPLILNNVSTTDLVTTTTQYATMTLTNVDSPSAGFVPGTIGGNNIMCTGNPGFTGKNSLICVGQNPSNSTKPVVVFLTSR